MSLPVRRTQQAETDFDELWLWIAQRSGVEAAERMTDRIEAAEDRLGDFPEIGQARSDLAEGVRHWPVSPFLIFIASTPPPFRSCVLFTAHATCRLCSTPNDD